MLKVLFISSGNSNYGISPIVLNQGKSINKLESTILIEYYLIKGTGIKGYLFSIKKLRQYLKKRNFDIVHAHYSLSALVATFANARPLVVSLMGSDVKASSWFKWIIYLFYQFFWAKTIVKSVDMRNSLGFKRVDVLPNGVNLDIFYSKDKVKCRKLIGWDPNKKHILFPSNPNRPEKNYKFLQDAIRFLNNSNIQIHTLVDVPHEKVTDYINASDIVVLTSLWEGSPNVIKEAMACNKPVVATDVGDILWLFGEEKGHFISDFNIEDLSSKIKDALAFSDNFSFTKGRNRIQRLNLDSENIANHVLNIYKSIVK